MATNEVLARLIGTMQSFFFFGGLRIKDSSTRLDVRNKADTAWADTATKSVKCLGNNASNGVSITAPDSLGSNLTITLPGDSGSSGYFLKTDGAGGTTWSSSTSNASAIFTTAFSQASSSPLTLVASPPANSYVLSVGVLVTDAAGGGSPTLSVGIAGLVARDMETTENDLKSTYMYKVFSGSAVGGSPAAIIATIVASGQTFSGLIFVEISAP